MLFFLCFFSIFLSFYTPIKSIEPNKLQEIYPKEDFYLCTDIDKYDFILKAKKDKKGYYYMEKS